MKNISFLLFFLFLSLHNFYAQTLVIDELEVSHFNVKKDLNVFIEGEDEGPFVRLTFTIINDTAKDIFIDVGDWYNLSLFYRYNNKLFEVKMIWIDDEMGKKLKIKSNSSMTFTTSTLIFLGTEILKENKYDYTIELLKILPTLKLIYDDMQHKFVSNTITNVIIHE